jgi:hypothetical protein
MGILIFTAFSVSPATIAASDAVSLAAASNIDENNDNRRDSDSFLDKVHEAITDASRPLHRRERNTTSRWGPRLKRWKRTVIEMLSSSSAASHAVMAPSKALKPDISSDKQQKKPKRPKRPLSISDTGDMFDHEMHEGARLISASFGLLSTTFGLVADGVRISGDTAAGFVGSSVRLMGTAVKSVSGSFESAGRALEPKADERRKGLTSDRLRERQLGKGDFDDDFTHGRIIPNAKSLASQSIKLVGNVIRGVGDAMLLAGEATETIAASTTGVAEDIVRIIEDFAGTLSSAVSPDGREKRRINAKVKIDPLLQKEIEFEKPYLSFGSFAIPPMEEESPTSSEDAESKPMPTDEMSLAKAIELGIEEFWKLVEFAMTETQGVPSFTPELLGVFILCYLATFWALSSTARYRQREIVDREGRVIHVPVSNSDHDGTLSELTEIHHAFVPMDNEQAAARERARERQRNNAKNGRLSRASCFSLFLEVLLLPFRALLFLLTMARRTIFSKAALLLVLYGGAWMYLCRASQLRSVAIKRNAEASGYRAAIYSIGSTSHSVAESVAWLNALMNQMWRVPYDPDSEEGSQWASLSRQYPKYVRRSIRSDSYGSFECRSCDWDHKGPEISSKSSCHPYGGLEPYVSGKIGTVLLDALGRSRALRRNGVAYASLYSFTLGKKPPLLRSIEFLGSSHDGRNLNFNCEVDANLEDLSLVLEVKLSSLEHAILPSTKVSVHAVDVTLPLKVSVSARPDYPFVSTLKLSLGDAPECNVRITPLSSESGLRGVDVGSLPVIREWVKDAIRESLSEYVSPNFIALDFASWFNSVPKCQSTSIPTRSLADITLLRQRTKELVNPNPRTPSSGGMSVSSVADTLQSHRSSAGTAFVQGNRKAAFDPTGRKEFHSLIKPTTELSKRGMDRFIEKLQKTEGREVDSQDGLSGLFTRSLATLSPLFVALAATVFTDRLTKDKD